MTKPVPQPRVAHIENDPTSQFVAETVDGSVPWQAKLDPTTYRMTGRATQGLGRPDGGYFDVPLISPVFEDSLWQGGCINGMILPDDFKYVVSLYPWERYKLPDGCERREFKLYDGPLEDPSDYYDLADVVNQFRAKGKTLVHCQAGLNRSALVTALALITRDDMEPADAIALLRDKRSPMVLCNTEFEQWLLDNAVAS